MDTGEDPVTQAQGVSYSVPQNGTPEVLETGFNAFKLIIETYGWLLLIAVSGVIYLYQKYKPSYEKWTKQQELLKDAAENKKNPEHAYTVQLKMEEARHRLQERVSADNAIKQAREKEIAEEKRREKIEEWELHKQGRGYHSKYKKTQDDKSPDDVIKQSLKPNNKKNDFRPAFNPLGGGGGGSSGYRPSRRNAGGG